MGSMEGAEQVNKLNARIGEEQAADDDRIMVKLVMVVKKVHTELAQTCATKKKKCMKEHENA